MSASEQDRAGDGMPRSAGAAWLLPAVVPVIAVAAIALDGVPAWAVAGGAAATAVAVALALGGRGHDQEHGRGGDRDHDHKNAHGDDHGGTRANQRGSAPTAMPDPAADLLRRAIEVRCAERTAILEHLTDAVLLVDGHGETRFANVPAREMLGADAATAGTRAAVEALPPQVLRAVQGVSSSPLGERRRIECELRNQDQTPVVITVTAVKPEPDSLAAIVVRNVRAEREADRMKSEFVAKASHELRTPLSSLRAYAELLADGEVTDEAERVRFANVMLAETARLGALVDRMLDISRIESGMARANFESVDLSALAEECVDAQRVDAERRRIALAMGRRSAGAHAVADRTLLKQVMLNLLSNAIKYTPEGGSVSVEVDLDNLARSVVVSVRDTGLGIPPHAVPRLFGKFYRVENHEKVAKGTGLGLNLCRNIVEATHGGQIGVDSQVGVGSRFWFAIPLEQAGRKAA